MSLERLQEPGGGVALLEKPQESDEKGLENARNSLTVIGNPSLYTYLAILMAKNTIPYNGGKAFLDVYFIMADKDYKVISQPLIKSRARATAMQVGDQLLYIISDENNVSYPIASLVPHESCRISPKEFQGFETRISRGNLEGIVNSMAQLIGERLAGKGFAYENEKLVLPLNYASTPLRY